MVDQVRAGAAAIEAATGSPPGPWFRFPYGARDARTIDLVNDECYVAVRWSVDSLGWKGTSGGMTTAKVRDRVLAAARPGMIVLMHVGANPDDGTTLDAAALPAVIAGLRAKGLLVRHPAAGSVTVGSVRSARAAGRSTRTVSTGRKSCTTGPMSRA